MSPMDLGVKKGGLESIMVASSYHNMEIGN